MFSLIATKSILDIFNYCIIFMEDRTNLLIEHATTFDKE